MNARVRAIVLGATIAVILASCGSVQQAGDSGSATSSASAEPPGSEQATRPHEGQQLIVQGYGSSYDENFKAAIADPFTEETGAEIVLVTMYSGNMLAQLKAGGGSDTFDIVQFSGGQEIQAAEEELIQEIDPSAMPEAQNLYEQATHEGYGPAFVIYSDGIIYNTEKVSEPPTSWEDLYDPEYAGHVAIPDITNSAGVGLLTTLAELNGGSAENIDPGFDAVERLLPNLAGIYATVPEMIQMLSTESAWLVTYSSAYGIQLAEQGLPVAWVAPEEGGPLYRVTMNIPTGSDNYDLALEFINYALRPEVQERFATVSGYAPGNKTAELTEEVSALMPYGEEAVGGLETLDFAVINEKRPEWTERWNRLIGQ